MLRSAVGDLRTRRDRRNYSLFSALLATPGNLGTGVALPAAGTLWVSTTSVLGAVTAMVTAGDRTLSVPGSGAGRKRRIGYFEQGVTVTVHPSAPGTVSLYVEDPAGVPQLIAQRV